MKRLLSGILAALLVVGLMSGVAAAESTTSYTLSETDATVSMPDGWLVATRDSEKTDPDIRAFIAMGVSYDLLMDSITQGNICLFAYHVKSGQELSLAIGDYDFMDFNQVSDVMLDLLKDTLTEQFRQTLGVPVEIVEYYRQNQAKFIVFKYQSSSGNQSCYYRQFYTVYANKAVNLTFDKTGDDFTEADVQEQKRIVDSLHFGTEPVKTEEKTELTGTSRYTDRDSGISFTVPAGWTEEALSKERQYIKAKFCSEKESGLSIVYCCTDIYTPLNEDGSLSAMGITRKNIDRYLTAEDFVTEMDEMTVVSRETYGGCDFVLLSGETTNTTYGISLSISSIAAFAVKNGYLIDFQFAGKQTSPYYADFIGMLSSVEFN